LASLAIAAPSLSPPVLGQPVSVNGLVCVLVSGSRRRYCLQRTSIHEVDRIQAAADFLDMSQYLCHIIKVTSGSIANGLVLPIRESICKSAQRSAFACNGPDCRFSYAKLMPLVMTESMVPFCQLFQLSAVPIATPGKEDFMSEIQPTKSLTWYVPR
jgi:hypothetical protein